MVGPRVHEGEGGERNQASQRGMGGTSPAVRAGRSALVLVPAALMLLACGGRGPVEELRPLLEALGNPTESVAGLSGDLYRLLDAPAREALESRAKRLSELAGVEVEPAWVLQARGVGPALRISRVELVETEGDSALVRVYFAKLEVAAEPGAGAAHSSGVPAPLELRARREAGGWRLSMEELAALVGRLGPSPEPGGGG